MAIGLIIAILVFFSGPIILVTSIATAATAAASPAQLCSNSCEHADDFVCDDGGIASAYSRCRDRCADCTCEAYSDTRAVCELGTDCNDCGPRDEEGTDTGSRVNFGFMATPPVGIILIFVVTVFPLLCLKPRLDAETARVQQACNLENGRSECSNLTWSARKDQTVILAPKTPTPQNVVERLLARRDGPRGGRQYFVRWEGYGEEDDSWEDESNINEAALRDFEDRQARARRG